MQSRCCTPPQMPLIPPPFHLQIKSQSLPCSSVAFSQDTSNHFSLLSCLAPVKPSAGVMIGSLGKGIWWWPKLNDWSACSSCPWLKHCVAHEDHWMEEWPIGTWMGKVLRRACAALKEDISLGVSKCLWPLFCFFPQKSLSLLKSMYTISYRTCK